MYMPFKCRQFFPFFVPFLMSHSKINKKKCSGKFFLNNIIFSFEEFVLVWEIKIVVEL